MKTSSDGEERGPAGLLLCLGCCPPSERHWFKWGLIAQPVLALALLALAHFKLL